MEPQTLAADGTEQRVSAEPETLKNYIGGRVGRIRDDASSSTTSTPPPARCWPACRCPQRPTSTPPPGPPAPRSRPGPPSRSRSGPEPLFALREALWAHREELTELVTQDMGKALDDARGEVGRGIESTEVACGIPTLIKGENLEGVATGVDVEMWRQPVGVVAAITPVQLPGDDPALVPAVRDRLRQHVHPQAVRARPADAAADRRADRRHRPDPGRRRQHRPRRPRGGQRAARPPRDRRDQLRRPGVDRALRDGAGHEVRQAGPGARRRQELDGRHGRRRPRPGHAGDDAVRVRQRRAALPRRLGRRDRRRRGAPRTRSARRSPTPPRTCRPATAPTRASSARRWSAPTPAIASPMPSIGRSSEGAEVVVDGRGTTNAAGALMGPTILDRRRPRIRAGPRGAVRAGAGAGRGRRPRRGARVRQRLPLRERLGDLHRVRRRPSAATATRSRRG